MEREYINGTSERVTFFEGTEIERTPAHGKHTLFVVGVQHVDDIISQLDKHEHIYLGANKSFDRDQHVERWMTMTNQLLERTDCWVTLDFPIDKYLDVVYYLKGTKRKFIPMISIELPHIESTGYNTCIKIDDMSIDYSNPGVWVHRLNKLLTDETLTRWDDYSKDKPLED